MEKKSSHNHDTEAAAVLKSLQKTVRQLTKRCRLLEKQVREQQETIDELSPKAAYYDTILQCQDLLTTTFIAKDYGLSARSLNKLLHELGIQYKQGEAWLLYAKYQKEGYLQGKIHSYVDSEGEPHAAGHSYWTPKGRIFLYDILKQNGILPLNER